MAATVVGHRTPRGKVDVGARIIEEGNNMTGVPCTYVTTKKER